MGNTVSCFERYGRQPGGPLVARRTSARPPSHIVPQSDPSHASNKSEDPSGDGAAARAAARAARRKPSVSPAILQKQKQQQEEEESDEDEKDDEEEDQSIAEAYAEKLKKHRATLAKKAKLSKGALSQNVTLALSNNGKNIEWKLDGKAQRSGDSFPISAVYRSQISRKNEAQLDVTVDKGKAIVYTLVFQSGLQCQEWDSALMAVKQLWSMA